MFQKAFEDNNICYDQRRAGGGTRRVNKLVLALVLSLAPAEALAIVRYMVQDMTCAQVQDAVSRDGVAILYRKSGPTGVPLYDRYVANKSFCQAGQGTILESVPTADTPSCRVSKCLDESRFGGNNR